MTALLYLLCSHYLADFGLQNDFTAKFKAPGSAPFWYHVMISHCAIQALPVLLITGMWQLALAEFLIHGITDISKCKGYLSFNEDQVIHILCKFMWWGAYRFFG